MNEFFVNLAGIGLVLDGGLGELEANDLRAPLPESAFGGEEGRRALILTKVLTKGGRSWTRGRRYRLGADQRDQSEDQQAEETDGKPSLLREIPGSPWNGGDFQGDKGIIV
jgi:hypothetical protein